MKYEFFINVGGYPEFKLEDKYWQLLELGSTDQAYLAKILSNLADVLSGRLANYYFGQEVYNLGCDANECIVCDTFEDWRVEHTISTQEIYQFLKDWKAFVDLNPR